MRVLVAEDDPVFRLLLQRILIKWGYEPVVVNDGEQAWSLLNTDAGPRLAILDWMMPEADGLEVCRRVRDGEISHYVYIVLLTGKTDPGDILAGLEAGADDYLPKPVNLSQLRLRLRAAQRVLEAEERHRMIAEIASDGIVTLDGNDIVRFANTAAGAIFGYRASELTGRAFSDLVSGFKAQLERPTARGVQSNASAQVRSWTGIELIGRHQTGRGIPLELSFAESVDSSQRPIVAAMIRDVTGRRDREVQAAHAQKLESIGQLAAGVAHEINTPIQYIGDNLHFIRGAFDNFEELLRAYGGSLQELAAVAPGSPTVSAVEAAASNIDLDFLQRECPLAIDQALEGVAQVAQIVRAMKEFSHPGGLETTPVDLNHLLENTALVCRNRWKHVANLKADLDPDLPPVVCQAGEISQVFLNLIVNAADAIGDAIKSRPGDKGTLTLSTRSDGEFAEVRVSDTGTGIPTELRRRVFDPFFTTKAVGSGTGQGLSIAYGIVARKHQGSIDFETESGIGTTFWVRLPVAGPQEHTTDAEICCGSRL